MKNRPFRERLGFACAGLRECWRAEASFRTHVVLGSTAFVALIMLHPAPIWWAMVGLVSTLVLAFELINSALERLIDHLHPDIHPEIGFIKDMASGAVLLISIGALVIATALLADLIR